MNDSQYQYVASWAQHRFFQSLAHYETSNKQKQNWKNRRNTYIITVHKYVTNCINCTVKRLIFFCLVCVYVYITLWRNQKSFAKWCFDLLKLIGNICALWTIRNEGKENPILNGSNSILIIICIWRKLIDNENNDGTIHTYWHSAHLYSICIWKINAPLSYNLLPSSGI